ARLVPVVAVVPGLRDLDGPVDELPPVAIDIVDDRIDHEITGLDRADTHIAAAGQEGLRARDPAPGVDAAEAQLLAGVELPAHDRVHPVAGHGDVGGGGRAHRAGARRAEVQRHALVTLVEPNALVIREDALRAEPRHRGVPQGQVQPAAMDPHLGDRVARGPAAWLGVDELAEAVEETALAVLYALARQRLAEAERGQLTHAVGQQRDAHAQLFHLRRALVHATGDATLVQGEREREPA